MRFGKRSRSLQRVFERLKNERDKGRISRFAWLKHPDSSGYPQYSTLLVEGPGWRYDVNEDVHSFSFGEIPTSVKEIFRDLHDGLVRRDEQARIGSEWPFCEGVLEVFQMFASEKARSQYGYIEYDETSTKALGDSLWRKAA